MTDTWLTLKDIHDSLSNAPGNKELFGVFGMDALDWLKSGKGFETFNTMPIQAAENLLNKAGTKNSEAYLLLERICRHGDLWSKDEFRQAIKRCGQDAIRTAKLNLTAGAILVAISEYQNFELSFESPPVEANENG